MEDGKGWGRGQIGAARKLSIARAEYEATLRHDEELAAHLLFLAETRRRRSVRSDRNAHEAGHLTPLP